MPTFDKKKNYIIKDSSPYEDKTHIIKFNYLDFTKEDLKNVDIIIEIINAYTFHYMMCCGLSDEKNIKFLCLRDMYYDILKIIDYDYDEEVKKLYMSLYERTCKVITYDSNKNINITLWSILNKIPIIKYTYACMKNFNHINMFAIYGLMVISLNNLFNIHIQNCCYCGDCKTSDIRITSIK